MKKLLLTTAACGLAFAATPAYAGGVKLDLGGYFKGYGVFVDQDETPQDQSTALAVGGGGNEGLETNDFDFIRDTEIHFGGETTLDNGLTVGAHLELEADATDTAFQESYVYFSGGWGRVNFGAEDGAAYLLQVAAPSADSNIDGIRQYIQPVNYASMTAQGATGNNNFTGALFETLGGAAIRIDYDQNLSAYDDKLTYLSPIMNGFQLGLSFSPDVGSADDTGTGVRSTDVTDAFGRSYEAALRYEGQFNNIGVNFGAGWSRLDLEEADFTGLTGAIVAPATQAAAGDPTDDRTAWNVGLDLDIGAFGIGAIYKEDDAGEPVNIVSTATAASVTGKDEETWVIGVDYTTGPFKFGASYFNQDNTFGIRDLDTERYSGGVTYTYGPGMTFRGSIGYIEHEGEGIGGRFDGTPSVATATSDNGNRDDVEATYVAIGTQINF